MSRFSNVSRTLGILFFGLLAAGVARGEVLPLGIHEYDLNEGIFRLEKELGVKHFWRIVNHSGSVTILPSQNDHAFLEIESSSISKKAKLKVEASPGRWDIEIIDPNAKTSDLSLFSCFSCSVQSGINLTLFIPPQFLNGIKVFTSSGGVSISQFNSDNVEDPKNTGEISVFTDSGRVFISEVSVKYGIDVHAQEKSKIVIQNVKSQHGVYVKTEEGGNVTLSQVFSKLNNNIHAANAEVTLDHVESLKETFVDYESGKVNASNIKGRYRETKIEQY